MQSHLDDALVDRVLRATQFETTHEFRSSASTLHEHLNLDWLDAYLSCHEGILDELVLITLDGQPFPIPPRAQCPDQRSVVQQALSKGATLKIEQLETRDAVINELCLHIERRVGAKTYAKIFITPAAKSGYPAHFDACDVLAVQLLGSKTWMIFDRFVECPIEGMQRLLHHNELSTSTQRLTMHQGDALFMRAGVGHGAVCEEDMSMHLSLGVNRLSAADVLQHLTRLFAKEVPSLRAPLNRDLEDIARLRRAADDLLTRMTFELGGRGSPVERLVRARESVRPVRQVRSTTLPLHPPISPESRVQAAKGRNIECEELDSRVRVYYTGSLSASVEIPDTAPCIELPGIVIDDLKAMLSAVPGVGIAIEEACGPLDVESKVTLAGALLNAGILELI